MCVSYVIFLIALLRERSLTTLLIVFKLRLLMAALSSSDYTGRVDVIIPGKSESTRCEFLVET